MSTINILETLPHKVLTPIPEGEKPTFTSLLKIHQELNANAMAISSNRGGGHYGHLALVLPAAAFNALPNTVAWVDPVHPGDQPVIPAGPPNPTAAQITEINRQYKADLAQFQLFGAAKSLLRSQLLASVPDTYTKILKNTQLGYANATALALLNHLDTTYGTVTPDDLTANTNNMNRQWDPTQPIEDLWNQIKDCQAYAEPHDPISNAHAIRAAINNLEASGVFTEALRKWRDRPIVEHTWDRLTADFNKADKERNRHLTTKHLGFANKAETTPVRELDTMSYCWSHGLSSNKTHTSSTCSYPQPGHQKMATVSNMMGGCCIIKRRQGERAVYRRPERKQRDENTPPNAAATTTETVTK